MRLLDTTKFWNMLLKPEHRTSLSLKRSILIFQYLYIETASKEHMNLSMKSPGVSYRNLAFIKSTYF